MKKTHLVDTRERTRFSSKLCISKLARDTSRESTSIQALEIAKWSVPTQCDENKRFIYEKCSLVCEANDDELDVTAVMQVEQCVEEHLPCWRGKGLHMIKDQHVQHLFRIACTTQHSLPCP